MIKGICALYCRFVSVSVSLAVVATLLFALLPPLSAEEANDFHSDGTSTTEDIKSRAPSYSPGGTISFGMTVPDDGFPGTVKVHFSARRVWQNIWSERRACSGTLIAPDVILTALHCALDKEGRLRPHFRWGMRSVGDLPRIHGRESLTGGDYYWPADPMEYVRNVVGEIVKQPRKDRDLIAIRIGNPVPGSTRRVVPVLRPEQLAAYPFTAWVGWGMTEVSTRTTELNYISIPVNPADLGSTLIPASRPVRLKDGSFSSGVCGGDSGGPLYAMRTTEDLVNVRLLGVIHAYRPPMPLPPNWAALSDTERCILAGNQSLAVNMIRQTAFIEAALATLAQ